MVKTFFFALLLLINVLNPAYADKTRFLSTGTIRARALAMGSAYYSIEDDFSAGLYNPGAFKRNTTLNERKLKFFFNPVVTAVSLYDYSKYDRDYTEDNKLTLGEALLSASQLLKGMTLTTSFVDMGFNLGEEILYSDDGNSLSGRIFTVEGLTHDSFHSAFLNVKIAPTVSLGITGTLYYSNSENDDSFSGGYTFGVLLTPNPKMNVGIAYNQIPNDFSAARLSLEDIENGSATSGISYHPDEKTVVSIDLRTVNKEGQLTSREIHSGLERRFGERIALRTGYFRKKATKDDVFSFGIGILPMWEKLSKFTNSTRQDIFSYTLIMEENSTNRNWHVLSLSLSY